MAAALDVSVASEAGTRCLFSPSCDLLGVCRPDGLLQVYDASLGSVKGEVAPSKHLLAACTCLSWRPPCSQDADSPKKAHRKKSRKRKSSISAEAPLEAEGVSTELAVGTASGSVIIYSTKTAKCDERSLHSDVVNDLAWSHDGAMVYSVSNDGHVGCSLARKSAVSKFRPGGGKSRQQPLFSVALLPERGSVGGLLVGSFSLVMWLDLDTKLVLRTFGGHIGAVATLQTFSVASEPIPYLLSAGASEKDRTISVWKLDPSSGGKRDVEEAEPLALLNVNETVSSLTSIVPRADEDWDGVLIGCVSKSGVFRGFEVDPCSKRRKKKAVRPKVTVQVASSKDAEGKVTPIAILTSRIAHGRKIHLLHGIHSKPSFETLDYDKMEKSTCLVREVNHASSSKDYGIKFMEPETVGATVLAPGTAMTPKATALAQKRKRGGSEKVADLPMLDRLRLLSKDAEYVTTPPRTDSLLQLLLQGLHNRDQKILGSVLDRADDELIDKTVRKLPVEGVVPLIEELQHYIRGRGMVNLSHSKWLRSVLQHHSAYLMSIPQCGELLGPVLAMLEARTRNYGALMHLKGKLDIMTRQISTSAEDMDGGEGTTGASKEALLVYQDDSSDELSDVLDELLLPASDNEESWNVGGDDEDDEDEDDSEKEEDEEDDEVEDKAEEEDDEEEHGSEQEKMMVNGVNSEDSDEEMESD